MNHQLEVDDKKKFTILWQALWYQCVLDGPFGHVKYEPIWSWDGREWKWMGDIAHPSISPDNPRLLVEKQGWLVEPPKPVTLFRPGNGHWYQALRNADGTFELVRYFAYGRAIRGWNRSVQVTLKHNKVQFVKLDWTDDEPCALAQEDRILVGLPVLS